MKRIAWLRGTTEVVTAGFVVADAWQMVSIQQAIDRAFPLRPPSVTQPIYTFVELPVLFGAVPLAGVWLLSRAGRDGGGRWGWRWWCGTVLLAPSAYLVAFYLAFDIVEHRIGFGLVPLILTIVLAPLWVLTAKYPRRGKERLG